MSDPSNTCPQCRKVAYDTAVEGMAEVYQDDNPDWDWDRCVKELDPQAISEETDGMLQDTTCEDWH